MTNPQDDHRRFPTWLVAVCCLAPLGALLAVCVGIATGNSVNALAVIPVCGLAGMVIRTVLGGNRHPPWIVWLKRPTGNAEDVAPRIKRKE